MGTVRATGQISIVDVTDAYSVILTSEAYTFVGGTSGVASGAKCSTQVVAFCGTNQCASVNVTASDINCPAGISTTVSGNGTNTVTINFTTTAVISTACEVSIPVVVDGITIIKKFSIAVAKQGIQGETGPQGEQGEQGIQGEQGKQGIQGEAGEDAITISITTSNGTVFKNNSGSTVLTAHVYKGGVEQIITSAGVCGSLGSIKWYKVGTNGALGTAVATANSYTVAASAVDNVQAYTCQLEG